MNNADINASLFKAVTHMNKVFILLVCELFALGIFIRHTKMSKKPLNLKIRQATSFTNFFNRIFILPITAVLTAI